MQNSGSFGDAQQMTAPRKGQHHEALRAPEWEITLDEVEENYPVNKPGFGSGAPIVALMTSSRIEMQDTLRATPT